MAAGWFASDYFTGIGGEEGIHVGVSEFASNIPGIHLNFLLIVIGAIVLGDRRRDHRPADAAPARGLHRDRHARLRRDHRPLRPNGDEVKICGYAFSNGRQSISPIDQINLPFVGEFDSATNIRPYFWVVLALVLVVLFVNFRLRDSRLGRAWIALREDEVAAASMGVPLVRTKLMAYAVGAAFGGIAGAFLGAYLNSVNANQFQFGFSIFILAMVILGGLGSIWGVVIGAVLLSFVNRN